MRSSLSLGPGKGLLSAAIIALAALAAYLWTHPPAGVADWRTDVSVATQHEDGESALPAVPVFAPLEDYDEVVARPLFSQTRRPPEVKVIESKKTPPPTAVKQTFTVTGVLITPTKRVAILQPEGDGVVRVGQGASVKGWRVELVSAHRVVLRKGAQRQELKLQIIGKKAAKSAPGRAMPGRPAGPRERRRLRQKGNLGKQAANRSAGPGERRRPSRNDKGGKSAPNQRTMPATQRGAR